MYSIISRYVYLYIYNLKKSNAEYFVVWFWVFLAQKNLESAGTLGWALVAQKWNMSCGIGNFTWSKKKYTFGGQKSENKPSEPKNGIWEFGAQNQYGHVTYLSIRNFTWSEKKYTFGGQKGKNKLQSPKSV
jgi:hypothetical protein